MPHHIRRHIALLAGASLLSLASACSDDGDSATDPDPSDQQTSDAAVDASSTDTSSSDAQSDVADGQSIDAGAALVEDLSVVPNPSNALSYYVEWSTTRPADTELVVECGDDWEQTYTDDGATTEHRVFVMGLWEGASCEMTATSTAEEGASGTATDEVEVGPLPDDLPELTVQTREADRVRGGWTMFNLSNAEDEIPVIFAMVDHRGRYRWYHQLSTSGHGADSEIRPMDDGVLIAGTHIHFKGPIKLDWEGNEQWSYDLWMHHDVRPAGDGEHFYYINKLDKCDQGVKSDGMVKFSRETGEMVDSWQLCDYWAPEGELTYDDWDHVNTIEPFPNEDAFLLSSRNQHSLIKLDIADGEADWAMGVQGDFNLEGDQLFYRQHAPELQDNGNIVLFDNGAFEGGDPSRPWSRAIEISYDPETMQADIVWEFRPDPDIFAPIWGDADRLDNGNTLVVFGLRNSNPDRNSRIIEVDESSEPVWRLEAPNEWGWYRADRVTDRPVGYVE